MNSAVKLVEAMKANPRDWRVEQLQTVARQHGIVWRQGGSSHCVFTWPDGRSLPVPAHRPIKPVYIRLFVQMLSES